MFTTPSFNFIQNYLADAQALRLEIMEIAKHLLRSQSKVPVTSAMFSVHPTVMIWMMRRPLVTRRSSILHKHALLVSVLEQSFLSNQKFQYFYEFTIFSWLTPVCRIYNKVNITFSNFYILKYYDKHDYNTYQYHTFIFLFTHQYEQVF